ncbi:MAG: CPBP family intramembrane glutamic endopeptidase, partial [Nitriliruptoraceae bacterium]
GTPWPPAGGSAPVPPAGHVRTRTRTPLSQVPSPYGLWIATFVVLLFMAPNLVIVGLALATGGLDELLSGDVEVSASVLVVNLIVQMVLQLGLFGISLLPLLAAGRPYRRLLGPTRTTGTMVAIGLGSGVVAAIASYTLNAIAVLLTGVEEPVEQQLLQDALSGGLPLLLVVVLAVVVAPLTEEVVFRGVLFRAMADRINLGVALVVSSAIFSVIHIEVVASQPVALLGLFTVGLLLALAYHLTGNLMVPILGHAVFNAISLGLAVLVDRLDLDELTDLPSAALLGPLAPLLA